MHGQILDESAHVPDSGYFVDSFMYFLGYIYIYLYILKIVY